MKKPKIILELKTGEWTEDGNTLFKDFHTVLPLGATYEAGYSGYKNNLSATVVEVVFDEDSNQIRIVLEPNYSDSFPFQYLYDPKNSWRTEERGS